MQKRGFVCVKLLHRFGILTKLVVEKVEGAKRGLTNKNDSDIIAKLSAREYGRQKIRRRKKVEIF